MKQDLKLWTSIGLTVLLLSFSGLSLGINPAKAQDQKTLRVGLQALPPSLFNPYRNTGLPYVYTWSAVFDGLTSIDASGSLQPWLATSWERTDPVTWVIELHKRC